MAVVALFTEFLAQSFPGSQPLVEPLMGDVLGRLVDPCLAVRRLCIRGLAWVGRAEGDLVSAGCVPETGGYRPGTAQG